MVVMHNEIEVGSVEHARETMVGDLVEATLRAVRRLAVPYNRLTQDEQTNFNRELAEHVRGAARRAVQVVAANARVVFTAEVDSVSFKGPDDVKAVLKMVAHSAAHSLADTAGGFVTVVIEDLDPLLALPDEMLAGEPDQYALEV